MAVLTRPIAIAELKSFEKDAARVWSEDERYAFIDYLARHPDKGAIIEGTGGVRVVYYFCSEDLPVYLLAMYGKGERSDLDAAQKKAARTFVETLKASLKWKRL